VVTPLDNRRARARRYHERHKADPEYRAKRAAYEARPEVKAARNERQRLRKQRTYIPGSANYDRDATLRRKYGISEADFNAMATTQGNACAICRIPSEPIALHVDHDHDTGEVRGLLCGKCNRGLGLFRDNESILLQAVAYLTGQHDLDLEFVQFRQTPGGWLP
jgi:hypothetical protein